MRSLHVEVVLWIAPAIAIPLGQLPNVPEFPSLPAVSIAPTIPTLTAVGGIYPSSLPPTTGGASAFPSGGIPSGLLGNSTIVAPTHPLHTPSPPLTTASFLTVTSSFMPSLPAPVPTSSLVPTSSSNPIVPNMPLPPIADPTAVLAAIIAALEFLNFSVTDLLSLLSPLAAIPGPQDPALVATTARSSVVVATITTSMLLNAALPTPTGSVMALPVVDMASESTAEQEAAASAEKKVLEALAALS
ncbi:hypothetical protein MMC11_005108 [Xylographa trunciseda]|nr:hypothetical protein [Xylographa trunciseda]